MIQTQDSLGLDHFGSWDAHMNKLTHGNATYQIIPNFKHLSLVVLKKKAFEDFSKYFMVQTRDPLG